MSSSMSDDLKNEKQINLLEERIKDTTPSNKDVLEIIKIFEAYNWLTGKIQELSKKKINNYNYNSIQGKIHNAKDKISWDIISKTYMNPKFTSPCHAAGLFGIITANGLVYPCEILEDKLLGNLRENNMDFMKIWKSETTKNTKEFIIKSKCNCSYECALSFNILGNWRYHPQLIKSALDF